MMKSTVFTFALLFAASVVDAGTDKTQAPTTGNDRPTMSPNQPPISPFPTPELETAEPTPSPTLTPVRCRFCIVDAS